MLDILPLGDSITEGDAAAGSYRPYLAQMLLNRGYEFRFVGSRSAAPRAEEPTTISLRHEGHSGWLAHDFVHGPVGWDENHGSLTQWVQSYAPDLVLLHVGTNDLLASYSPEDIIGAINAIVEVIHRHHASAEVLVGKVIPIDDKVLEGDYGRYFGFTTPATFSAGVREVHRLLEKQQPRPRVTMVDVAPGWDLKADLIDGIHPSASGHRKMARGWLQAIRAKFRV